MSKKKLPRFTTPKGVAIFPRLNEPDYKFDAAGVFSCKLAFDPADEDVQALKEKLEALRDEEFKAFVSENPKKKAYKVADVFSEELDEEGDPTGRILLNTKMKHTAVRKTDQKKFTFWPDIFDGLNQKLIQIPNISGGSVLRASFEAFGAGVDSSKTFHLSMRLQGVKIIKLVSGGRTAESMGFGDDDDCEFEADDSALKGKRKEAADDAGSDDDKPDGGGDF